MLDARLYPIWKSWPGVLISFLFVGLLLGEAPAARASDTFARPVLQQTVMVWFIALGQLTVGFACALTLQALFDVNPLVAHIVEIGWIGGHGSAAALTAVVDRLGHRDVGDLAIFSATMGLIWGGVSGILLVNYLRKVAPPPATASVAAESGVASSSASVSADDDDAGHSALLHALLLMILVVAAGYAVRAGVTEMLRLVISPEAAGFTKKLPVFFIALVLAAILRRFLLRPEGVFAGLLTPAVAADIRRLTVLVLDTLIVSAVATLSLKAFFDYLGPFAVLMTAGALWCLSVLLVFAPRMLPRAYWRELGILNYGMSTGVTALGLLLLRSYRAPIPPEVARVYGMAAPFSAPFIGGGMISLLLPELTARGVGPVVFGVLLACVVSLFLTGRYLQRRD